jgi:tripartite-type tricarboxylate transporter receptor subunit TctC
MMKNAPVLSNLATSAVLSVIAAVQVPALAATGPGDAAQAYPDKPIRLMVPYAPGGNTDILARVVGQRLTDSWGKQVVVDNAACQRHRGHRNLGHITPDGHTVFVGSTREISVNPTFQQAAYTVQRDFLP